MRKLLFFGVLIFLSACSRPQPLTEDAAISIELEIAKNNGIIVSAKTNLPPESHMNISLYDSKAILNFGSAQAEVNAEGIAQFEALRDNNTLGNGKYLLEITTPLASVQSESVQKIIGDKGQYLTGPLVDESDIFPGQRTLEFQQIIAISDSPYTPLDQVVQNHLQAIETYRKQFIDLYTKLMEFKSSPKFHEFGFSPASPYYQWNQDENSLRDKYSGTIMNYTGLYSSDLWYMAIEYKDSGGKETDFTREKNKKIREQLALPPN